MTSSTIRVQDHFGDLRGAVALVLGSGLSGVADLLDDAQRLPYAAIPGWPAPTVAGHQGEIVVGRFAGQRLLCFCGRFHLYEGHNAERVGVQVQLAADLGIRRLLLTNAAGGIRSDLSPGTLMWIADQINLTGDNPLTGLAPPRFLDLTDLYRTDLYPAVAAALAAEGVSLSQGILCGLRGPTYETPAEIRMLQSLGADAVSMSTVNEAIHARARGMELVGLSVIANRAAGLSPDPLDHADVLRAGRDALQRLPGFLHALLCRWEDPSV